MNNASSTIVGAPTRYSPLIVTLHWLMALCVLLEAFTGVVFLHFLPNTAVKITPLVVHMALGVVMIVLMIVRVFARVFSAPPVHLTAGHWFLDLVGGFTHFLLYLFTVLSALTGAILAIQSRVLQLMIGRPVQLPIQFASLFTHAAVFALFGLIVGLHILASLYHQFVRNDKIFSRIWYVPRRKART